MKPLKVICIDDSNRPDKIPEDLWVEKNTIYTITEVVKLPVQGYKLGYKLEEIELNDSCFPYEFYDAERFMFLLDVSIELITHDLDDIEDDEDDDTPAIANFESLN